MKKTILPILLLSSCTLLGIASLSSCASSETKVIIQFVPSRNAEDLAVQADALEPILKKYAPGYDFDISTGTSYAAVTEGLLSDQVDFGFLTASGYAQVAVEEPGKVQVLLTSVRAGYKVQADDYPGITDEARATQVQAMNGEIDDYVYRGEQSTTTVNYYNSILMVLRDEVRADLGLAPLDADEDGTVELAEMAGHSVARQGETSGAGYLYPSKLLYDNDMSMVAENPDPSKGEIQGVQVSGYDAALADLMSGAVDGAWGFMDIRYANGYNKEDTEWYQNDEVFTNTYTVAMTSGIYNDTISARANLDDQIKTDVANAFKSAIKDEEGATILYDVYSHTGYTDATDAEFEGEKEMYQWKVDHLS